MNKKIIGIFVCTLLIATALTATGAIKLQTNSYVKENNYFEPNKNTATNSPDFITIKIVTKVDEVHDPYNLLGGAINVNDTVTGKYTYDSETPDTYPDDLGVGVYWQNSSSCGIEVKAGGFVFKTNASDIDFAIGIFDNAPYYYDSYVVVSNKNLPLSNGMLVELIYWWLCDETCTVLSSDTLPTTAPKLSI